MTATTPSTVARWQQCGACGHRLDETDARTECPDCGGLLDIRVHLPSGLGATLRQAFAARGGHGAGTTASGVWRYAELLMDVRPEDRVSFPEGNTPIIQSRRLADWARSDGLSVKHEGMNPTGSFKDRGMTVGMTQARRLSAHAVACASTGNTAASLAAYAALAGLPAFVLVPAGRVATAKLAQSLAYGARVVAIRGDFDASLALVREASRRLGVYLLNSVNPWRVEGQKTIVLELLQQLAWRAPDWIALPGGNLGNTAAFGKALEEALAAGLIDRLPRLLVVQAAGAAPFASGFATGFRERQRVSAVTIASAIRIGDPASWHRAVRAVRITEGAVVTVSDEEILQGQREVGRSGIGCEPASAASVAGVRAATASGLIRPEEQVVAILTGHVLKDPGPVGGDGGPVAEIAPELAALAAVFEQA